jgi:hypothetical protein
MALSAMGDNGNPVDWRFAYKVPKPPQDASNLSATVAGVPLATPYRIGDTTYTLFYAG